MLPVYPRVGGGTGVCPVGSLSRLGLSPRGRGNLTPRGSRTGRDGSIPAWAGEPTSKSPPAMRKGVYPRVGGGTVLQGIEAVRQAGLSPRGRGNLAGARRRAGQGGSIPAWAGEPRRPGRVIRVAPVYPRVGGGTRCEVCGHPAEKGLSPRGRGNLLQPAHHLCRHRSIPAWAGEPGRIAGSTTPSGVYPRVGGGTTVKDLPKGRLIGLSPRGRGNLGAPHRLRAHDGSIPAWAGEPTVVLRLHTSRKVYPRVGGGTLRSYPERAQGVGLSPRGRGNRLGPIPRLRLGRSIPAWAGEPTPSRTS